ncbi:MAG: tyrosine-type recombinase/integrase [Clostridia bacterium]|nr:tyrosine-type recombinase/integrase [Clostridia bacterium]
MDKHGIDVKAYIREKKGLYYVSIVYVNSAGKRKDKSFPTKLPVKGNKKKAELMAKEILENFEIPVVDLYLQDASAIGDGKEIKKKRNIVLPKELIEQVTLSDLTKEQVSGMLFADYLEKYLPIVKKRGIEETTYSSYAGNVKNPIGPHFRNKNITLGKLTSKDIQDFYDIQLERVTANTVIHYHAIIRLALCYARKMGYIKENPIEEVEKPEKNRFVGSFYQSSELNKIIELTRDTKLEFAVIFGGFYGLRRSEIVGLRWSAIDFENNVFYVNHTVTTPQVDGKKKIIAKDRAKTKSSIRALPLDESVKARLIEHKRKQEMYRKKFKRSYSKEWLDYIMVDELGGLILPDYITSAFSNLLKANGLRHIRFHDLRHTCASLLLNKGKQNGVTLKDIQVWLGHSDFSTTANIYSHLDANSKISSLDTLSGVVNI